MVRFVDIDALVAHLLGRRHEISNREIIACLAIAQLRPTPRQRLHPQVLMDALQIPNYPYLSHYKLFALLTALARHGLVEYEAGTVDDPGYLFWRVGPKPSTLEPIMVRFVDDDEAAT